jgi:hypothetical protein
LILELEGLEILLCSFEKKRIPLITLTHHKRKIMKNKIFAFAVIGCMAGIFLAGCDKTSEQKVEETKQELKQAKADYAGEWQKFKTESEAQIKVNEDKIDAYKEKMEKAGHKAKVNYKKAVAELKEKNHALKEKLDKYEDQGESKWEEFKTNFNHDLNAVGETITNLFKDKD